MNLKERYYVSTKYHKMHPGMLSKYARAIRARVKKMAIIYPASILSDKLDSEPAFRQMINEYNMTYAVYYLEKNKESFLALSIERGRILDFLDDVANLANTIADGNPAVIKSFGFYPKKIMKNYIL